MRNEVEVIFTPRPYDAVARGVALLDEKVPDWRERINPEVLEMRHCFDCVIGQLFGDFDEVTQLGPIWPTEFGFDITGEDVQGTWRNWEALNAAWRDALTEGAR